MSTTNKPKRGRGASGSTRSRARATVPPRCERPKAEDGRPCRRYAGAGTDHQGLGPCVFHDDGSWQRPAFAENVDVQEAFLRAVRDNPSTGIRELIEPLGYARRDVVALSESDPEFESRYVEARGYDADAIRNELRRRAMGDGGSDRLLEFVAKMKLPEARELQRMRFEGRLDVQAVPYLDPSQLLTDAIRPELAGCTNEVELMRALLSICRPQRDELPDGGRPALELMPGASDQTPEPA